MEPVRVQQWWQGRRGRNRLILLAFGLIVLGFMVFNATGLLTAGDTRQLVVGLRQPASDADRAAVKQACGGLPGIAVVPDRGAADRQATLPVRFSIAGSTQEQEAAVTTCLEGFGDRVAFIDTDS